MRSLKMFGVLLAVLAFGALGAATASAHTPAKFTATAGASLTGTSTVNQVFTINGGRKVTCTTVDVSGTVAENEAVSQVAKVKYTNCTAFGFVSVDISEAEYEFTANGTVHILKPITITVTKTALNSHCTVSVPAQTVNSVDYKNNTSSPMDIEVIATVGSITYSTTENGPCPAAGHYTDGTYTGTVTVFTEDKSDITWDATVP